MRACVPARGNKSSQSSKEGEGIEEFIPSQFRLWFIFYGERCNLHGISSSTANSVSSSGLLLVSSFSRSKLFAQALWVLWVGAYWGFWGVEEIVVSSCSKKICIKDGLLESCSKKKKNLWGMGGWFCCCWIRRCRREEGLYSNGILLQQGHNP